MEIPKQTLQTISFSLAGALFFGCFDSTTAVQEGKANPEARTESNVALRTAYMTYYFSQYFEAQSNGGASVEKFADCPEGWVLTGWGGRVNGDGNFTDIKIRCTPIGTYQYEGRLMIWDAGVYPSSTTPAESWVTADDGQVVVGVGGVVNGNNLVRATIKQCPWTGPLTINAGQCTYKSSDGSQTTELFWDAHNAVGNTTRDWKVLTGIGATAGSEVLKVFRGTIGVLKRLPLQSPILASIPGVAIGYYSFTVPEGGKNVSISIGGYPGFPQPVGNADLYVGHGFQPTTSNYTCRPYLAGSFESCNFQSPGEYHALIIARTEFSGVYLRGEYTLD